MRAPINSIDSTNKKTYQYNFQQDMYLSAGSLFDMLHQIPIQYAGIFLGSFERFFANNHTENPSNPKSTRNSRTLGWTFNLRIEGVCSGSLVAKEAN